MNIGQTNLFRERHFKSSLANDLSKKGSCLGDAQWPDRLLQNFSYVFENFRNSSMEHRWRWLILPEFIKPFSRESESRTTRLKKGPSIQSWHIIIMIIIQNLKQSLFPQNMYLFFVLFLLCLCVLYNVSLLLPYSSSSFDCSIFTRLITQFIPESRKHRVFIVLLLLLPPLLLSSLL